ncbi:unnamed protein product, partial [Discosporangium mesarthrocarpum]
MAMQSTEPGPVTDEDTGPVSRLKFPEVRGGQHWYAHLTGGFPCNKSDEFGLCRPPGDNVDPTPDKEDSRHRTMPSGGETALGGVVAGSGVGDSMKKVKRLSLELLWIKDHARVKNSPGASASSLFNPVAAEMPSQPRMD